MKVYLIKASAGSSYSEYKKMTGGPPQNIFSTAATTPKNFEVEITDETIGMKTNFRSKADVIAIFMSTPDAIRAYNIAEKFKQKGKIIVLGGLHTKFMPDEASKHADAILIGEVEEIWENLLIDVVNNRLKERYERTEPFNLEKLKPYPTDIVPMKKYNYTWSVVVSRGCPFNCSFCLVPKFTESYRLRPIASIVQEIKNCPVEWIELHSDNLTANRKYALELFEALKPLNKKFFAETTILIAKDKELLKAAKDAGIKVMLFGIETFSKEALKDQNKSFVKPEQIQKCVKIIQSYDIEVVSDFLFGFDAHDSKIFEDTLLKIQDIGFNEVYPHLLIPFPGSRTYKQFDNEGRILTKDWSKYDGSHAVFKPKLMTPKELENGTYWFWKKIDKLKKNDDSSINDAYYINSETSDSNKLPIKSILALFIIAIGIYYNKYWVWGFVFLLWTLNDLKNGYTYLFDLLRKDKNPVMYWLVTCMWLFMSLWIILFAKYSLYGEVANSGLPSKTFIFKKNSTINTNSSEKIIYSKKLNLSYKIPNDWIPEKISSTYTSMNITSFENKEKSGSITLLNMNMKKKYSTPEVASYLEIELQKEMKYIDFKNGVFKNNENFSDKINALPVTYKEYQGYYSGYPLKVIACYGIKEEIGFILFGVFTPDDIATRNKIVQIFKSLKGDHSYE